MRSAYIEERGGVCELCKVPYPSEILEFHHPEPSKKERTLSVDAWRGVKQREHTIREADSCHLLCANCHRMEHIAMKQGRTLLTFEGKHNE